mmetsp:Transcript_5151/g.11196  ORF Transcript_5151/g.11196 Transcript_5151/m.11196 type:complete len:435 (-) Transcript_5151:114-1418(-)|eukprot:CAMPEP_0183740680 /NCGR_PEP_ID=MMETSP0737-20130205/60230_1 /TAXON_ID=385413 /ORGANISM="Thalassiosira miniscula, Strain CCMP1093" /LENGTH=434 /DNA_ID=CAMNT_0025975809 /DNA_START=181 /DNA_END=1485 /DNA_ORIENTATION=+
MNSNALAIGTITTTLATITTLLYLVIWTATSDIFESEERDNNNGSNDNNNNGNDDGGSNDGRSWWENLDLKGEEQSALKLVFGISILTLCVTSLAVPMMKLWHPTRGVLDKFHGGVLASALFLVGNMLFVTSWFAANFVGQEEDENGSNDNNNNDNDDDDAEQEEMDAEQLLYYHRQTISTISLAFAIAFLPLSICLYQYSKSLPETSFGRGSGTSGESMALRSTSHMELFADIWKLISISTIGIFAILFLLACAQQMGGGEDGERRREEGWGAVNLILILFWLLVISVEVVFMGCNVLGLSKKKKLFGTTSLGVGILSGGTCYYALLLFLVCLLYADFATLFEERRREEGAGSATATSFACFFLGIMHLAFSAGTLKYRESIAGAIEISDDEENEYGRSESGGTRFDSSMSSGDFQRLDDDAMPKQESSVEMT